MPTSSDLSILSSRFTSNFWKTSAAMSASPLSSALPLGLRGVRPSERDRHGREEMAATDGHTCGVHEGRPWRSE